MSGAFNLDRFVHDLIPSTNHSFLCFSDVGPLLLEIKSPFPPMYYLANAFGRLCLHYVDRIL